MRLSVLIATLAFSCVGLSMGDESHASIKMPTRIPPQPLGTALQTLARDRGFQVVYESAEINPLRTKGASGELSAEEALTQLLSGTGFTYKFYDDNAVSILPVNTQTPRAAAAGSSSAETPRGQKATDTFRLAQENQTAAAAPGAVGKNSEPDAQKNPVQLEEVVVTAQKRSERVQEVPVPVTSIDTQSLVGSNQLRLQDYYSQVPGLSVTPADTRGAPILAIRGITTGGSLNPTVGIMIDDIPYGSSNNLGGGFAAPDIDPSDLSRIEVLRGPQGTLYGASSIGGLLKYVTVDPSTDRTSGHVQVGASGVRNGDGPGYSVRGAVNAALSDTFAVRVSGFRRQDPGYITNVLTNQDGINRLDSDGGRLSALWRPLDGLSFKLSALLQHSKAGGAAEVDQQDGLGDLQQSRVRGSGGFEKRVQAYSLTVGAHVGAVEITSLTGYSINKSDDSQDFTSAYGAAVTQPLFQVLGTPTAERSRTNKLTQEIRLSGSASDRLQWLVGGFYTHESSNNVQDIYAADPLSGIRVGQLVDDVIPSTYEEYAGFADLTWIFSDRFDVQFGARESQNRQAYRETLTGPLYPLFYPQLTSPVINPEIDTQDNSFTYLVTPRYRFSPDLMIYARLASGYRPGGPNQTSTIFNAPPSYRPDKTKNYEIGAKGNALNHALEFDASVYYIDWKDIQLTFVDPVTFAGYFVNASRARSQGLELSLQSQPLRGLTLAGWVSWNDATLTAALPVGGAGSPVGNDGSRLPNTSRFSGNISVQQDFPLAYGLDGFVQAMLSYVGDRQGVFTGTTDRQSFPGYAKTDLRTGLKRDNWTLNLYITNATDRRGLLTGGLGTVNPNAFTYIQPRAFGISLDRQF